MSTNPPKQLSPNKVVRIVFLALVCDLVRTFYQNDQQQILTVLTAVGFYYAVRIIFTPYTAEV